MNERGSEPPAAESELQRLEEPPRYASLVDYLRVLDRHKVLVAVITIACGAAAFLYSATRPEIYEAQAELSFQDLFADVDVLGVGEPSSQLPPSEQAAFNANLITRADVEREARRRMDTAPPLEGLDASVSARVGTPTNLVIVEGRAADAQIAAALANAYAQAAKSVAEEDQLERVRDARQALLREIEAIGGDEVAAESAARLPALEQLLSRLEAIEQVGEPVRIVSRAEIPEGPTSPRTRRNTAIGGLVGLIVGLLAAFGRASLDRRVHTAEEVHRELGAPVLAWVGESALGCAGLAANAQPPMVENDFEPFRVLRTNLAALGADSPPRSLLVTSALPEEGKSTVSMALASAAAIAGQRVLLVECDLRRSLFDRRLGVSRAPGITDYLRGSIGSEEIVQTVELSYPTPANRASAPRPDLPAGSLACIAAGGPVPNPAELLITDRFRGFLEKVTKTYDLVVLDGGPLLSVVDPLELIPQVDATLICVRAQQTTVDQVRAARAALANLPERPIGVVLTGLRRAGPDSYDSYYGY